LADESDLVYAVSYVASVSGATPRAIQLWADAAAIKPQGDTDRQGSGAHRAFSRDEVIIACVLARFWELETPIGRLREIGALLRFYMARDTKERAAIEAAIRDDGRVYLVAQGARVSKGSHSRLGIYLKLFRDPDADVQPFIDVFEGLKADAPLAQILLLNPCLAGVPDP
jgi:DNA-binding transcriptional MerR regulator